MKKRDKLDLFSGVKYIMGFTRGYRLQFIVFFIGWFIIALCEVIVPIIFSIMINQIIYYKNMSLFLRISGLFIILTGFNAGMYYFIYQVYAYLSNMYTYKVRHGLFKQMQKLDAETMSNSNYGDISVMIQWHAQVCMDFIVRNIIHSFNHVFKILFCIVIIVNISPYLALAMMVLVPIVVFINIKFGKQIRQVSDKQRRYYGEYIGWIFEVMQGFRDLRLLGATPQVMEKFEEKQGKIIKTDNKSKLHILTANHAIQFANVLFRIIIFVVLALLMSRNNVMIGAIIITCSYYEIIQKNMQVLSERYMESQKRLAIIQKISDFMKYPTTDSWQGDLTLDVKSGDISFEHVVFGYEKMGNVLDGVTLEIKHGEKCAVVGKSGCGKTTLSNLLAGFYTLKDGKIKIDEQDISQCSLRSIHKEIGVVQQDVMILNGSIRENIIIGNKRASEEELVQACKCAGIYEFIMSLDNDFDTILGREGRSLSGGQRQRIAIARIYLRNTKVIVFDEATSALDSKTEELIYDSWKEILNDKTAIIIAHRLSSVMLCDKVALMDKGKIVKVGTPEELYKDKTFRELFAIDREGVKVYV